MSDLMFYGVLRMPYEMAMSDELSRRQFWSRAQEAADRVEAAEAELARRAAQPADVGAGKMPQAAEGVSTADAVSLMLWLYRRLPRAYGRPPHVEAPIAAMAKIAGIDVADSFSERDPTPPLSSEQQDPPINQCDGCRQGAPMTSLGNHIDSNGKPFMYCQKQRYESFGEQQAEKGEDV